MFLSVAACLAHVAERTALMYLRRHMLSVPDAYRTDTHATGDDACITFVVGNKFLERECLAGIAFDTPYDALAAYGTVIRNIVVHA